MTVINFKDGLDKLRNDAAVETDGEPVLESNDCRDTILAALESAEDGSMAAVAVVWVTADGEIDSVWSESSGLTTLALRTALRDADSELRGSE